MNGHLSSHLLAIFDAFVSLLASGALTVAGLLAEWAGVQNLVAGQAAIGLWEVWMGGVALFVGLYLVGYGRVVPRIRAVGNGSA
ncbi:putative membrane protein [Halanaeroarchaeum sp. HSR-CO]|uniref:hypothetical protein n=1 Tax=Halanaeroarchaeum sp. HSR-CO TaxID=2866382 RepID=UPI00217E8083|nr:hypothetical protein [Halanaeroarchaeum sp. HSR-CO]UWG46823.1 putative membrane protein [Halanaeroarchaeum sp. HSR-CO]